VRRGAVVFKIEKLGSRERWMSPEDAESDIPIVDVK